MIGALPTTGAGAKHPVACRGFTVLEILVAVVILGLAYVAVLQNFSLSARNITRMEEVRSSMFANALAFEAQIAKADAGEESTKGFEDESVFLEGGGYDLVLVADPDRDFMTMILKRR